MKISRPSPALVVSIVALIVACAGTATAASLLVTNSSQVKAGSINGSDIANRSLSGLDLKDGSITTRQLKASVNNSLRGAGLDALEAVRRTGPNVTTASQVATVATLQQLAPGSYALFGKTTLSALSGTQGLLGELLQQRQGAGHCVMDAGGDIDDARGQISGPGESHPHALNLQMTRSFGAPTDVVLKCDASVPWKATDTSIIAIKLAGSNRTDVTG